MSNFSGYKTKAFSENQKFFVLDPNTGSPAFVQASDLVEQITPNSNYVYAENTRTSAQATDYAIGSLVQTAGDTEVADDGAAYFLVVASGEGDFPMNNGNELLFLYDDDLLRVQLASNDSSEGSDLVAHTGTTDSVTEALNKRTIYVGSVAELEALSLPVGTNVYLTEDGRAGEFVVKTGTPPSDPQKGIYIVLANGNYAERNSKRFLTPIMFGAAGDGVANDSAAIQAVCDVGGLIYWPANSFRMQTPVTVTQPVTFIVHPDCKIIPDLGVSGGSLFAFETDDVHVEGLTIDGTGLSYVLTENQYMLFGGDGTTKYYNHTYLKNTILNVVSDDGNSGTSNLLTSQGIYIDNVDNVTINHNRTDNLKGASVFVRDINGFECRFNDFKDNLWYPIHLVGGIIGFEIAHNRINSGRAEGIFYGGGIDLMSQQTPLEVRNRQGSIHDNYLTGLYSYGSVFRILSCEDVQIYNNKIEDVSVGSVSLSPSLTGIRVDTRGVSAGTENGPVKNITVRNNRIVAGTTGANQMVGIYVSNQWQTARTPAFNIKVYDNKVETVSATKYWESGIIFTGNEGGLEDIWVNNNEVSTFAQSGPIVDGAIGFASTVVDGTIRGVHIGGNTITDIGTPASSFQLGIGVGAFVDEVFNDTPNTVDNYFYGVRTFTNSGPTLDRIDDQNYLNITSLNALLNVPLSRYGLYLENSVTYDPPSLAANTGTFTDVTVSTAEVGDFVEVSFPTGTSQVMAVGNVRALNVVRVTFFNSSASPIDLASGTLKVRVYK